MIAEVKPPKDRPSRIALLGCGNVGREVAHRLVQAGPRLGAELVSVLVRDPTRDRGLPASLFTDHFGRVLDAAPDLVVELIGGLDPAGGLVAEALGRGIPVVTANKTLIAHQGERLAGEARRTGVALAYEASVCAAVPVLASLRQLEGDRVLSIRGIVNGSCNYILTRLGAGLSFEAALAEARARGLVEPDPSADISGRDSAEKVCVLAAAAGVHGVTPEHVECEGIERVGPDDLKAARRLRCTIKLIAELDLADGGTSLRVGPTLVPLGHPLAGIEGEENGVVVTTDLAGELFFRGKGAGPGPTASAVLGDVVRLLSQRHGAPARPAPCRRPPVSGRRDAVRLHHIRIRGRAPRPEQVFASVRSRGGVAEQVDIGATGSSLTAALAGADARACAAELAAACGGETLVLPVLG